MTGTGIQPRIVRKKAKRFPLVMTFLISLTVLILSLGFIIMNQGSVKAAPSCSATLSTGGNYKDPANEDFGTLVDNPSITPVTDAKYSSWSDATYHYEIRRFAVQSIGTDNLNASGDVDPAQGYPTISCTDTVDPTAFGWNNGVQTIYPTGVQLGVPQDGASNGNGQWQNDTLNSPSAVDNPPVYQRDYGSAAAEVDDAGAATIGGSLVWCQALTVAGCPPDITTYGSSSPGDPNYKPGAGALFESSNCNIPAGGCLNPVNFNWFKQGNTDLVADGLISANGTSGAQTGLLQPFQLSMTSENTHASGFQAEMFLTFKYPLTNAPTLSLSYDCTAKLLEYTFNNTSETGAIEGFYNGVTLLGANVVPPYSGPAASFPMPATSGTFSAFARLVPSGTILVAQSISYNCPGGVGSGVQVPSCGSVVFTTPLPYDPGQHVQFTANIIFNNASITTGTPGAGPYSVTVVQSETTTMTGPPWPGIPVSQSGTSVTFNGIVPNQPNAFPVNWQFDFTTVTYNYGWDPGHPGSPGNPPNIPPTPPDPPHNFFIGTTGPDDHPGPSCSQPGSINPPGSAQAIFERPYMKVYGGDVSVGEGFADSTGACTSTPNSPGAIYGWNTALHTGNTFYGSGAELAVHALANIKGFASAQASSSATVTGWALTFANTAGTGGDNMGGQAGSEPCIYPYYAHNLTTTDEAGGLGCAVLPGGQTIADLDPTGLTGDHYYNVSTTCGLHGLRIAGASIQPGQQLTIYVNGSVLIDRNVVYNEISMTNISQLPLLRVIANGNIYITPNVTQLDGLYVAEGSPGNTGTIYDCSNDDLSSMTSVSQLTGGSNCVQNQLIVNGALVANTFKTMRTIGTFELNTDGSSKAISDTDPTGEGPCLANGGNGIAAGCPNAGEVINYGPEMWLAPYPTIANPISPETSIDSVTSLPPIL